MMLQKQATASSTKRASQMAAPRATHMSAVRSLMGHAATPIARARKHLESRRLASLITRAATAVDASQETTANPLPIVFVAAECAPWSKTGGLGDVVGGLPIELAKRGHKVMTIAPRYDQYSDAWDTSVIVNIDGENVRFFHSVKQGVHRVWVDHPWFLAKVWGKTESKLYGPKSGADFVDNHKRFAMFCKAAIEATRALPFGFGEDVAFVANDWHSALVPVLLKDVYQARGEYSKAKCALCIHNIAFQGRMWEEAFKEMNLPQAAFDKLAFTDGNPKVYTEANPLDEGEVVLGNGSYRKINWLKAGIIAADKVITVSPNYASEIVQDVSGGVELDGVLRSKGEVVGIVNGMDTEEWDPRVDKFLTVKYDKTNVYAGKAAAKEALQAEVGLPVDPSAPLFSFIGRLEEQKGVDILLAAVPKIMEKAPNAQIVILGTGKAGFESVLKSVGAGKPNVKGIVKFSAPLAHLITAGADFILVPSRFEPCGLIQLHAMQYGTVPVVASTGGLVDTVKEGVTGFHMGAMDKDQLLVEDVEAVATTVARASQAFSTPLYKQMVYNCISQDLGWSKPAKKWEGVLEKLFLGISSGQEKAESVTVPVQQLIPGPVAATDKPLSPAQQIKAQAPAVSVRSAATAGAGAAAPSTNGSSNGSAKFAPGVRTATAAPKIAAPATNGAAAAPRAGSTENGAAKKEAAPAVLTPVPRGAKSGRPAPTPARAPISAGAPKQE